MGHLKAKKLLGYHQAWLKPKLTPRHPTKNAQVIRWIRRINGDETLKLPLNQNQTTEREPLKLPLHPNMINLESRVGKNHP